MSELPCITVYFLPTVCIDCFLYLKTEMHSYCIQSCVLLCPGDVLFCSEPSFRRPHLDIFLLSVSVLVSLFQVIHEGCGSLYSGRDWDPGSYFLCGEILFSTPLVYEAACCAKSVWYFGDMDVVIAVGLFLHLLL